MAGNVRTGAGPETGRADGGSVRSFRWTFQGSFAFLWRSVLCRWYAARSETAPGCIKPAGWYLLAGSGSHDAVKDRYPAEFSCRRYPGDQTEAVEVSFQFCPGAGRGCAS